METGDKVGELPGWEYIWASPNSLMSLQEDGWRVVGKHAGFMYTKYLMERKRDDIK